MMGVMPVHQGVPVPQELRRTPGFPTSPDDTASVLYVPEIVKSEHEPAWEERFQQIFA